MEDSKTLKSLIYFESLKSSLIPIFLIEVLLVILYFSINFVTSQESQRIMEIETLNNLHAIMQREANKINDKLRNIRTEALIIQHSHQNFFENNMSCFYPNGKPNFSFTDKNVFYKTTDNGGSSVYYSNTTKIGSLERKKAECSEILDPLMVSIVKHNPIVTQIYLNTWDDMNRIYPFIPNIYEQYGESINMEDFNFYYEADLQHNPKKGPIWTDTYLDPAGQGIMISNIVPIYNGDFLEAVSGLDITINSFISNILNLKLQWNSYSFMLNEKNEILAIQEEAKKIFKLDENSSKLQIDINFLEEHNSIKLNNSIYIVTEEIVKETGWKLFTLVERKEIFEHILKMKLFNDKMGYIAILTMVIFYILFFIFLIYRSKSIAEKVTKPILELAEQTTKMGENLEQVKKVDCVGIDEIDKLNFNFNTLHSKLNKKTNELVKVKLQEEMKIKEINLLKRISKYLSPQVYKAIFDNGNEVSIKTKRKKLTVFFSDIVNFTETTQNTQPEELTLFLNRYLTEMSNIALKYGATIDKFIGDAILVFFGDPDTKGAKEDAIICVKMALEMQSRTKELKFEFKEDGFTRPFSSRMGIATGYTTVGNFGSENKMEYTIIGSTVNLASRLESNSKANKILISEETYQLIKDDFDCIEKEPIKAKGFHRYIPTYEVIKETGRKDHIIIDHFKGFSVDVELDKLTEIDRAKAIQSLRETIGRLTLADKIDREKRENRDS